ncbi:preprotein translocase subunit YajC [uncultured bacterium]|uniref:Preprotein translocase subunit YajC n=2 Tax=Acetilactobacillus jinshanensis TaxID=1720083 RepID=A0A4P6ZNP2_9LACO|nr:preprotein translocase subunit YajC [Acetilactobacillus jinshanensis]URL61940.1 preprotein translocase subunit YajC [uncultured bacterium]
MVIILFALMYFLMIRPQKKRQRKHADLLKNLKKGDRVVTIGRMHGTIAEIDRKSGVVSLDCDGIRLIFDLRAIASVENHLNNAKQSSTASVSDDKKPAAEDKSKSNK